MALDNYNEAKDRLEKNRPEWLRALMPRSINAPAEYWPQKMVAVHTITAAFNNYISVHEEHREPNPAHVMISAQTALLIRHDVPTYHVSRELVAAALRTQLPDDLVLETIPFPF